MMFLTYLQMCQKFRRPSLSIFWLVFVFGCSYITFYSLDWCANLLRSVAGWQVDIQGSYSDAVAFMQWRLLVQDSFLSKPQDLALWHFWQMEYMKSHCYYHALVAVLSPSAPVYGLLSGFKLPTHPQSPTSPPYVF